MELILLYYAGHGEECKHHSKHGAMAGNLLGIDYPAMSDDVEEWPTSKLDGHRLFLAEVESMFAGITKKCVSVFLVDACRSVAARSFGKCTTRTGGISSQEVDGFTVVYASGSGKKALDEPTVLSHDERVTTIGYTKSDLKAGSPFAIALNHHLLQSAKSGLANVLSKVCEDVKLLTGGDQEPDVAGKFLKLVHKLNDVKM